MGSSLWQMDSLVVVHGLSCPVACGILVPRPGIEPESPPLASGFLTTGPPWGYPPQSLVEALAYFLAQKDTPGSPSAFLSPSSNPMSPRSPGSFLEKSISDHHAFTNLLLMEHLLYLQFSLLQTITQYTFPEKKLNRKKGRGT